MSDARVTFADLADSPELGRQVLNDDLALESFGMSFMVFRPGQQWRIHVHEDQEEVYLVLSGELTLLIEGDDGVPNEQVLRARQVARVSPGVRRQVVNRGPVEVQFIAIGAAGRHERWDALAWHSWEQTGKGLPPEEIPLPNDLAV